MKISWEDIGRYAGSAWGDRISDVGIWVREREEDPSSARLALSALVPGASVAPAASASDPAILMGLGALAGDR